MKITLIRSYNTDRYCIGHLYIDGKYFCDTLEDTDRGLDSSMPLKKLQSIKIKSRTAIPTGLYAVTLNTVSPKYSKKQFFNKLCNGKMPRLLNVPAYEGILIHTGNKPEDTDGCLLVGYNKVKGGLVNSTEAFVKLYEILSKANEKHEGIYIEITRKYKV